jgi:hypothetical protein
MAVPVVVIVVVGAALAEGTAAPMTERPERTPPPQT